LNKSAVIKRFFKELSRIWSAERPTQLAAALAYYGIFSFAPIIFISVSIAGLFVQRIDPASQLFQRLEQQFGPGISNMVKDAVTSVSTSPSSSSLLISLISFLALLYAASGLFYQLQYSLDRIWHMPASEKGQTFAFLRQRLFSFLIVIGFGLVGVIAIFANVLLAWFGTILERLLGLSGSDVLAAKLLIPILVTLIFALFYKILPETKVAWKDVWLGAILSTTLMLVAVNVAGIFFKYFSPESALQATGAFTVLLVGFFYIAQIFLLGAICCRVYAELYGSKRSTDT
jgi:membrane protein